MITFVDHLVFRVRALEETERFYTPLLGSTPQRHPDSLMYKVGDTRLFFTRVATGGNKYDKEQVGLNHLAFGLRRPDELRAVRDRLDAAGIAHSGIQLDRYGKKEFIWTDDPDGMRVEFYLRPVE